MNSGKKSSRTFYKDESGVAMVTVIMISVLLLIACVAILSAVGSHSRNVTDVLSESKAYYAAESGLQSTINVLRGNTAPTEAIVGTTDQDISYRRATTPDFSNLSTDPNTETARLSRWLSYNYTPTGATAPDRVVIGDSGTYNPLTGVAYKVEVIDPDRTDEKVIFSSIGGTDGSTSTATVAIPSSTATDRVEITFGNVTAQEVIFPSSFVKAAKVTTLNVQKRGTNAVASGEARFKIEYRMTYPRSAIVSMRGKAVVKSGGTVEVTFDSYIYEKVGSNITLCGTTEASCASAIGAAFTPAMTIPATDDGTQSSAEIWANITPVEPYRLQIVSTGYGPNGATKKLEAVIQRNFFNDLASSAAVAMIGPTGSGFTWEPGNSRNVNYCGVADSDPDEDCVIPPPGTPITTVPSVGLTDPSNYQYVVNNAPQSGYTPPPALINNDMPDWQQSTTALDELVNEHRLEAQPDTYYQGTNPPYFGTYDAATDRWNGITFCEGNCDLTGNGGGILVVTGKLTLVGNFSFKGLIIVTGAGGVDRRGAGNGAIIGNLVIAPYDPNNLGAGFLPPKYDMRGGGISDIIFSGSSTSFDGQTAISDFMQGVSEK